MNFQFNDIEILTKRILIKSADPIFANVLLEYLAKNFEHFAKAIVISNELIENRDRLIIHLQNELELMMSGSFAHFFIFEAADIKHSRIIGDISVNNIAHYPLYSCQIGCKLDKMFQGSGVMFEAMSRIIELLFDSCGMHRIEANISPDNFTAIRLVEKLGFEFEGIVKHYIYINGSWIDNYRYALINLENNKYEDK